MNLLDKINYATKTDLKKATGIHAPNLTLKSNLDMLKAEVDIIDVDKLNVSVDLSQSGNLVNNEFV